jgi:tRNA U34 5-carboxymethylaminomethyl modifying GTPase MnmE/TrmE
MSEEEKAKKDEEEPSDEELDKSNMAFANAQVVRVMKSNMAKDKMIKAEVKVAMNKFLEKICSDVSQEMNNYPYVMMDYRMFKQAVRKYEELDEMQEEKRRIIKHLEAIKADADKLIRDIQKTLPDLEEPYGV